MKLAALLLAGLLWASLAQAADPATAPLVIAHCGASGYLPEHTLAGYEFAVKTGADYIEPDLQLTLNGVLVAIHDDSLPRTTDVADLFGPRGLDGQGGRKVADFALAEIRTLTVKPTGTGAATCPGVTPRFPELRVPTFDEVIAFAKAQSVIAGRTIGIYPEAKQADPAMEDKILATLARERYAGAADKVFVQSFSDATVKSLDVKQRALGLKLPLSMKEVAAFANGIGVAISNAKYRLTRSFVDQAHAAGLAVHGWTFAKIDPAAAADQYKAFLEMGLDGLFSNYSDLAVKSRNAFVAAPR